MPQIQVGQTIFRQVHQVRDTAYGKQEVDPPGVTEIVSSNPAVLGVSSNGSMYAVTGVAPGTAYVKCGLDVTGIQPVGGTEEWAVYDPQYTGTPVGVAFGDA